MKTKKYKSKIKTHKTKYQQNLYVKRVWPMSCEQNIITYKNNRELVTSSWQVTKESVNVLTI